MLGFTFLLNDSHAAWAVSIVERLTQLAGKSFTARYTRSVQTTYSLYGKVASCHDVRDIYSARIDTLSSHNYLSSSDISMV